jgi:hypothetical protein
MGFCARCDHLNLSISIIFFIVTGSPTASIFLLVSRSTRTRKDLPIRVLTLSGANNLDAISASVPGLVIFLWLLVVRILRKKARLENKRAHADARSSALRTTSSRGGRKSFTSRGTLKCTKFLQHHVNPLRHAPSPVVCSTAFSFRTLLLFPAGDTQTTHRS